MWSLPDIVSMNSEARIERKKLERAAKTGRLDGKKLECEWKDHDEDRPCVGELRHYLWYDIFSDDPKGILTLCEHHDGYYGSPSEGYFICDDCERVMTENYTWELYYHADDGGMVCLPCYAKRELAKEENWIPLTDERIEQVDWNEVRHAHHLIAVEIPKEIKFVMNAEFDSSTGGKLTSSTCLPEKPRSL